MNIITPATFDFLRFMWHPTGSRVLYLIAGANGSGKTTLAHELLKDEPDLVFVNADEVRAENTDDKLGIASGRKVLKKIDEILSDRKSVAFESTISGNYHKRVIERFRAAKYEVVLIYVFLDSVKLNLARVKHRVLLGGHDVPDEAVVRRYNRSVRNFWEVSKLADRWNLYYNGDINYIVVAQGNKDNTEIFDSERYESFKKGLNNG